MSDSTRLLMSSPHMSGREQELVADAFASNWIAPVGPYVAAFEDELAKLSGIKNVAALSSGTAALHLALRLSGIGPRDEVWCPTMTFIGGVAPILYQGAQPVFLDVDEDTMLIDLDLLEERLVTAEREGALPKVVLTTDLYGFMPDTDRVLALRERYGFIWISDAAESVGSYRDGRHAGSGADFAIFSFNGNKIITTSGGGALLSNDAEAIEQARFLSTQAREPAPHYEHKTFGYNYRLSNICAAIGVGQLEVLAERVRARRAVHDRYRAALDGVDGIRFSVEPAGMKANRWLTTILIDPASAGFDAERARLSLDAAGIESRPVWKPMHQQPLFAETRYFGGAVADLLFARGLCLPSGSAMTEVDIDRVITSLLAVK
ncbi:aminotransferase class I/II-fold pyridoxal phosphate-dependent enzyme [Sphingomonas sp. 22L2VL55-3]